ncbi:MAG: hypothetical protein KDK12_02005 [Rhodobacteraceae bacterium]|nr:hypothetical protein [Paracoccaceae bacterium]
MTNAKPSQVEAYRSAVLSNGDALAIALGLVEGNFDVAALGLRVEILNDGRCRLVDPVVRTKGKGKAQEFHGALVQAMQLVLKQGAPHGQAFNSAPLDLSGLVPFPQAAFALVAHSAVGAAPQTSPDRISVYIPEQPSAADLIAGVMRLGRDARLLTTKTAQGNVAGSLILLSDAAEDYGLASSLLGRPEMAGRMRAMAGHVAGARLFWIDAARPDPSPHLLVLLDRFCDATRSFDRREFAWLDEGPAGGLLLILENAEDGIRSDDLATATDPVQPFTLSTLSAMPDRDSAELLRRRIAEESHRFGYRVSLQPVPRGISAELDVGPLIEEIEDLKQQIQQIEMLRAPQLRLLRFSDAQLPAMVDALRRLPPTRLKDGSLLYAAGHSTGRAEPAHYLMHDITVAPVHIVEALWRVFDGIRPISYWLDPFVAEYRHRIGTETLVFVPENSFLVPSLAHFGGDLDGTLRLVVGNLFANIEGFLARPGCRPVFLFTPTDDASAHLEVEVVDAQTFQPLHQTIGWMNDYLRVRSPGVIDREKLTLFAEELYDGDYVNEQTAMLRTSVEALAVEWQAATDKVRDDAVTLIAAHAAEIEQASGQIESAQSWLKQAEIKLRDLETLLRLAASALRKSEQAAGAFEQLDARLIRARMQFEARVANELERSERGTERYKDRLQRLRRRIEALRQGYEE